MHAEDWIDGLGRETESRRDCDALAYEALRQLGVAAVPDLIGGLSHERARVRTCAARLLAELGPKASRAREALIAVLEDHAAKVRRAAIDALLWIGDEEHQSASTLLNRLTRDRDREVRIRAARALGIVGSSKETVVEVLARLLDDSCPLLRGAAAESLGQLAPGNESVGALLEDHFLVDDRARPALAVGLARAAPERLVHLAVHDPATFWANDRDSDFHDRSQKDQSTLSPESRRRFRRDRWCSCSQILMSLADLGPEAAAVRQVFVRLLTTKARASALYALGRVGAAARDTVPAIAAKKDKPARAALRTIAFAAWHADKQQARGRLAARLKARDIAPERIAMASALEAGDSQDWEAFNTWARSLNALPLEARVRVGHAAARDVVHLWQSFYRNCNWGLPTLLAIEDWMAAPGPSQVDRMRQTLEWGPTQGDDNPDPAWAILRTADLLIEPEKPFCNALSHTFWAWERHIKETRIPDFYWRTSIRNNPTITQPLIHRLRQVVRDWVVPWALGEGDPVRESLNHLSDT